MKRQRRRIASTVSLIFLLAIAGIPTGILSASEVDQQNLTSQGSQNQSADRFRDANDRLQPVVLNYQNYTIPGFAFSPEAGARFGRTTGNYIFHQSGSAPFFTTSFWLPSGALLTHIHCSFYDSDPSATVEVWVADNYNGTTIPIADIQSQQDWGYTGTLVTLDPPYTILNVEAGVDWLYYHWYSVVVRMLPTSNELDLQFGAITFYYELQVCPAPTTATFNDVSTSHWAFQHIEGLSESGITSGCGGGSFCPNANVTRAEMAVFLAKALGLQWPYNPWARQ